MIVKPITTIEEAKAALDAEISSTQSLYRMYRADADKAVERAQGYGSTLNALQSIRSRMEPQEEPAGLREVA